MLKSLFFWDVTRRRFVVIYRPFGTTYGLIFNNQTRLLDTEDGTDRVSRNTANFQSTLRKIPEEGRSNLHRIRSLILRLPWLRVFHAFSSVVRQMQNIPRKDGARSALLQISELCVVLCFVCVDCVVLYIGLCVNVYCTTATGWQPSCS